MLWTSRATSSLISFKSPPSPAFPCSYPTRPQQKRRFFILNVSLAQVLGNKNDIEGAANVEDLITKLQLKDIQGREVCCYSVSAKNQVSMITRLPLASGPVLPMSGVARDS